jgi:hypothetical protein
MKILVSLVLISITANAQTANLRLVSSTPQQAVLQYMAPDNSACKLTVIDNSRLGVTVWDVSGAKFPNSDFDLSRANTTTRGNGLERQVVVGSRSAQIGTDGRLYSRSLQANTLHTFTVTCGGQTASVNFMTANPPVGNMSPDPVSYNSAGFGNASWPAIDWTVRNTPYIDPKTGILLRPGTWFNQMQFSGASIGFMTYYQATGTWTSPSSILSRNPGTLAATNTTDPIFVSLNPAVAGLNGSSNFEGQALTDIRLNIQGNISGGGDVKFCLTQDSGQNCISRVQTITLRGRTGTVSFPPARKVLVAPFTEWGMTTWPRHDLVQPWTNPNTINTSGATATNTISAPNGVNGLGYFPLDLPAGSKVLINRALETVASVRNNLTLVTKENLGTHSGVDATAANFGFKIWKAAPQGTMNINVSYDVVWDETPGFSIEDGASDQCSRNTINVTHNSSGAIVSAHPVNLCILNYPHGVALFAFDPASGDMWQVGLLFTQYGSGFADIVRPGIGQAPWDPTDGHVLYIGTQHSDTGAPVLARASYRGDGTPYSTGPLTTDDIWRDVPNGHSARGTRCKSAEQTSGNVCLSILTDIDAGHDLATQMAAINKLYSQGAMGYPRPVGVVGKYFVHRWPGNGNNGSQDTVYGFSYTNLSTGNMDFATDSMFGSPNAKGCAVHTAAAWIVGNRWHGIQCNPLGQRTAGQWVGPVQNKVSFVWNSRDGVAGTWNANTTFDPSYSYSCPAGTCGTQAVSNTIRLRIPGQLCNSNGPAPREIADYPCPWAAKTKSMMRALAAGDSVTDVLQLVNIGRFVEAFKVIRLVQNSTTDIDVWLQRAQNGSTPASYTNGWSLALLPTGGAPGATWWIDTQSVPFGYVTIGGQNGSHEDFCPGTTGTFNFSSGDVALFASPNTQAGLTAAPRRVGGWGRWQNLSGNRPFWPGNGQVEFYPSCRQHTAPDSEKNWVADWRAYQGGSATTGGAGTPQDNIKISQVSAGARTHVWKAVTSYNFLYPKLLPIESWAGAYIFKDASSPVPDSFTDSSNGGNWAVCVAYRTDECVKGSAVGDLYYSSPNTINNATTVWTNNIEVATPGFSNASPIAPWAVQTDISRTDSYRRLTMAFAGPGRNYTYKNWRPTPEGKWGFMLNEFVDGVFPIMFVARVPPWPGYDSVRRDAYVQTPIQPGSGAPLAEIRFGYEENGAISQFFCMPREEACVTKASPDAVLPFNWIVADGHSGSACASGCTIQVPAISGRVLWWQEFTSADNGVTWMPRGTPQPLSIP